MWLRGSLGQHLLPERNDGQAEPHQSHCCDFCETLWLKIRVHLFDSYLILPIVVDM